MVIITQLIYVVRGQEAVFDQFEAVAIPIIAKYNGELMLRVRPAPSAWIEGTVEPPYEIHLVSFASEEDFSRFMKDEERKQFLHLKEASMRASVLVKGARL
jgi:uncharacterized protein (DUF1330 family)